ncbi:MAG: hypothetical protein ABFD77_08330 [Thermotogota bacterium]
MKDIERRNGLYEALAWSALFLWMGIASLVPDLPAGAGLFGVGGILLVLNLARRVSGIPVNRFTAILGAVAAALGATIFVWRQWFAMPPVDLGFFPTLFLGIGIVILAYTAANWRRRAGSDEAHEQG